jgi:type IX secretion system PorP/SprF family membrane protein
MKKYIIKIAKSSIILVALCVSNAYAQLSPPASMYFLNEYLYNPAMAGKTEGLGVGLSYKNNLTSSDINVKTNILTVEYGKGKNGFGLSAYNDKDGLISLNKFAASYAYNLKTSATSNLRFGLSVGLSKSSIDENYVGEFNDPMIYEINQRGYVFDADLGINYSNEKIDVSISAPNWRGVVSENDVVQQNYTTLYASAAYTLFDGLTKLTPKVVYRSVKYAQDVLDIGANAQFAGGKFNLLAFYHTDKAASFGLGFDIVKKYKVQAAYAMPLTSGISNFGYSAFELGLKVKINK